jgi:DNA/RNA endonuclease G (NUC1)
LPLNLHFSNKWFLPVSVDDIQRLTGYDLLANVPDAVEQEIESQSDKGKASGMYLYSDW